MDIEADVLKRIIPSNMEIKSIEDKASRLKSMVVDYISRYGFDIKVMFTGSFSKGTFLQDTDLDLFLMFPKNVPRSELERIGLEVGKNVLNGIHIFSEHPYTHGNFDGIDVDIVPCYVLDSTKKLQSSVDRTPFHTYYIKSHLTSFQKDQVRLLKKFMKTIGTYGQDQYTRGFSGYLCELLVAYYGSFLDVLRGSQHWHNGTSITICNSGPNMKGTLIVYDPVDPYRNAASAVHLDTISRFIVASKAYLLSPSMRFFFLRNRRPASKSDIHAIQNNYGSKIVSIIFKKPNVIDDNLWSQLWKTQHAIQKKLDELSFNVLRATHNIKNNKLEVMFELEQDTLPNICKHYGPPVWIESSRHFLDKWRGNTYGDPFIENGRWVIITKRTYCTAKEMLENEIKNLRIGKNLDYESMIVYNHSETLEHEDPSMIMELLDPKMPWEC